MADQRYAFPDWLANNRENETKICDYVARHCWDDWRNAYRPWWRQIEENVRMLAGRQYEVYVPALDRFENLAELYGGGDEMWRQYPVFNWLATYYKLTLSKLTENPPALGFLPATPDERDARLAQLGEPLWKAAWSRMDMPEQMFRLYGWNIVAARGIVKIQWNPDLGPAQNYKAPAIIRLFREGQVETREVSDAPYIRLPSGDFFPHVLNELLEHEGQPMRDPESGDIVFMADEAAEGGLRMGPGYQSTVGDLEAIIPSPASVIVPHGPEPFHRKPWYCHEYLMDPEDVGRKWDIEVEPEDIPLDDVTHWKLEYGTNYGMPGAGAAFGMGGGVGLPDRQALQNKVRIREVWYRDRPGHQILGRGRLLVCTKTRVLVDDINPYWVQGVHEKTVMPFEAFDLVPYPFRQEGTADLETMNPVVRALNRRMGSMMDATDFNEQSPTFINKDAMIEEDPAEWMRPGKTVEADFRQGDPAWRLPAPDLPANSVQMAGMLREWLQFFGSQPLGSQGVPVTETASGELQRQVRFDTDRVWGATLRLHSYAWARLGEKLIGIYGACMDDERLLTLAGEDQGWDFLTLAPQMFQGTVHAYPAPESAVLESRDDKQMRILTLSKAFPNVPQEHWIEMLGYPDLRRLMRPGGPAWAMAERENMEMALGQLPEVLPEHDHETHILSHKRRMQTIEYRDAGPLVQTLLRTHVAIHEQFQAAALVAQVALVRGLGPSPATPSSAGTRSSSENDPGASARRLPSGPTPGATRPQREPTPTGQGA